MKILLIIALIFTALTALAAFLPSMSSDNDPENAQLDGCFAITFLMIAGIFYALWALGLLIRYLLT